MDPKQYAHLMYVLVRWRDKNGKLLYDGEEVALALTDQFRVNILQLRYFGGDALTFHGTDLLPDETYPDCTNLRFPPGQRICIEAIDPPIKAYGKATPSKEAKEQDLDIVSYPSRMVRKTNSKDADGVKLKSD